VSDRPVWTIEEDDRSEEPVAFHGELVQIRQLQNTALIPLVKSILQAQGIRHFIKNERTHELMGYMRLGYNPWIGVPEVLVDPARAEEARELLAELEE